MKFQEYTLAHLPLVLFCAKLWALWVIANYTYPADPVAELDGGKKRRPAWGRWFAIVAARSFALACIAAWMSGWNWGLGAFTLVLAVALPLVRGRIASRYLAELEIGANVLFLFGVASLALQSGIPSSVPAGSEPASRQMAAAWIVTALVFFVMRGGSYMVRGILDKGKILSGGEAPGGTPGVVNKKRTLDTAGYNHGRIIGTIERLMLLAFVAMKAYDALAFLLTAKGLFRAKELDKSPAFAEYFLVGTLASSMIAIAAGLGVQFVLQLLW